VVVDVSAVAPRGAAPPPCEMGVGQKFRLPCCSKSVAGWGKLINVHCLLAILVWVGCVSLMSALRRATVEHQQFVDIALTYLLDLPPRLNTKKQNRHHGR